MHNLNGIMDVQINDKLIYSKNTYSNDSPARLSDFSIKSIGLRNNIHKDKKQGSD